MNLVSKSELSKTKVFNKEKFVIQKDKFTKLIEAVNYSDATEFRKKASIIKETYFSKKTESKTSPDQLLTESVEEPEAATYVNPDMRHYVESLSRSVKK
jgi:hypothetical protein